MSIRAINAAWKVRGLLPAQKLVLINMADHANSSENDLTFISQELIARECCLSVRTVIRIQRRLAELGHIEPASMKGRAVAGSARTRFFVHPTNDTVSPVTHDNEGRDTCQPVPRQVTTATPTGDNGDTPNITTINQVESIKRVTDAISGHEGTRGRNVNAHRCKSAFEGEMMARIRELLGESEMKINGGAWRNRIRNNRASMESALGELKVRLDGIRAGVMEPIRDRGAWLTDTFKRFKVDNEQLGPATVESNDIAAPMPQEKLIENWQRCKADLVNA